MFNYLIFVSKLFRETTYTHEIKQFKYHTQTKTNKASINLLKVFIEALKIEFII